MNETLPETAGDTTPERPWPVRHLTQKVKEYVDRMPPVWVEGQVLNLRRWKHLAFLTLRDVEADASMSATLPYAEVEAVAGGLADGARVIVHAKPTWWTKSGSLQLDARELRTVGLGELLARLEALRERLAAEGLFDDDRKVPLPFVPNLVGLVCANQGDAEHDVVVNARERWPSVRFEIRRVTVQGATCVPETTAAIRELDAHPGVDVIVVARGGGSLEDLLPFSSEALIRAVAECATPLVSAIGHEKDSPLLDLVADLRASTPTDAGGRIVPDAVAEGRAVVRATEALRAAIEARLDREAATLMAYLTRPVLVHPDRLVEPLAEEITRHRSAARRAHGALLRAMDGHLAGLAANLRALSPQSTLDRGYSVVRGASGAAVRDAAGLEAGERVAIRFARGAAEAEVIATMP
ncbi:MAG TPA: exodeoxyribonuclease VII large subunit [Demequinaceae bacterium]